MKELSHLVSLEGISFGYDLGDANVAFAELKNLPNLKTVSIYVDDEERRQELRAALPGVELNMRNDPR